MENRVLLTAIKRAINNGWIDNAACRDMSPDVFFVDEIEDPDLRTRAEKDAKQVCVRCPVLPQCQAHALGINERYGIIGGLTENERSRARRRRGNPVPIIVPELEDDDEVSRCGTQRGYNEHKKKKEQPCLQCRLAKAAPLLRHMEAMTST